MTAWTSDPPEREGWYWVANAHGATPACFGMGWGSTFVHSTVYGSHEWRDLAGKGLQRSVEPLTPPEPPK